MKSRNLDIFLISSSQSFNSQILKVTDCPLRKKCHFFIALGVDIESSFDHVTFRIKLHSIRSLQLYLNDKNLINGRQTVGIVKFTAQSKKSDHNKNQSTSNITLA